MALHSAADGTVGNGAYSLRVSVTPEGVTTTLKDLSASAVLADAPYVYRASRPVPNGTMRYDRVEDAQVTGSGQSLTITGHLAGLELEHTFTVPADKPYMEERIALKNASSEAITLSDFEAGFMRIVSDPNAQILQELQKDRLVEIPFRHRSTDALDRAHEYSLADFLKFNGVERRADVPWMQVEFPSRRHAAEGWAWTHGDHTLGVFKFNQDDIEWSAVSPLPAGKTMALQFGGAAIVDGRPSSLRSIAPGQIVALGVTRYQTVKGDYTRAYYAFRAFLDERQCRFPKDYDPPVHWNELYDNPEWTLSTPGKPEGPRMTRPKAYTKALIELEAAKARDYSCESLYLDPGWDTDFGTFLWGEQWLGPRKAFVDDIRAKYGLGVSLHCPLATWMSMDGRGVSSWPKESLRMGEDGKIIEGSVCLGAKQYLDEAAKRLLDSCSDGVTFLMFDGNWWNGGCWNPNHGHPVPYTREDHARANVELARRVHEKFPKVLIEMHDMVTGGSAVRYTPVYYKYGLPGSYDENWGLELMWDSMKDIQEGRASALYYYNLGCNVPMYLHVDLRDDNEHCLTLWWFASTCRHLGIGGTHENPQIADAQKRAMQRYHALERYYKRGEFFGMQDVGSAEPAKKEEIHLHVLQDEGAFVVNLFNLSDKPRRISGGVPVADLGLDPNQWYVTPKGCGFNANSGWFHVDRQLGPWGTYTAEVRPLGK
ncbi:MAG: hypothetical protein HZB26_12780 [Candidatus Hydrogenedentes bacterium]|nr:hypothetical protein [Candidatus Hydrogenedentota bacterium]